MEALFGEVAVEGEDCLDPKPAGGLEDDAVDQAELSAPGGQQGGNRGGVQRRIDPLRLENWHDVALEGQESCETEAVLDQGERLQQNIIGAMERGSMVQETLPDFAGLGVMGIVRVEDGQQGGGIDEDVHSP
jgi:hypothetical protein